MTKIEVTEDHIKHGNRHSCVNCPIALAIQQVVKTSVLVTVTRDDVRFSYFTPIQHVNLPDEAKEFIRRFDGRYHASDPAIKPFTFNLSIPGKYLL